MTYDRKGDDVSKATVKLALARAEYGLSVLAAFTPTKMDDLAVSVLSALNKSPLLDEILDDLGFGDDADGK